MERKFFKKIWFVVLATVAVAVLAVVIKIYSPHEPKCYSPHEPKCYSPHEPKWKNIRLTSSTKAIAWCELCGRCSDYENGNHIQLKNCKHEWFLRLSGKERCDEETQEDRDKISSLIEQGCNVSVSRIPHGYNCSKGACRCGYNGYICAKCLKVREAESACCCHGSRVNSKYIHW